MLAHGCRFCTLIQEDRFDVLHTNSTFLVVKEGAPVVPGHLLIVSRSHYRNDSELCRKEWDALFDTLEAVRDIIATRVPHMNGYNIGWNTGEAAGQTQMHFHIHVLPRTHGDVENPRGGVRNLMGNAIPPLS
jgi:diadenosine tetraphosphate (Ap4A) HIT family hydrolase